MKVHAYRVERTANSQPLRNVFQLIADNDDLEDRIRMISSNGMEVRAEAVERRNGYWLCDFVRFRTEHGPGRAHRQHEIQGFQFDREESFGEETALLYDPRTRYVLIQYNHDGVRAGSIAEYLSVYNRQHTSSFEFEPKLDDDAEARLQRTNLYKRLELSIAAGKMNENHRRKGVAVSDAIPMGRDSGAEMVSITLSMGQGSRGFINRQSVERTIRWARRLIRQDEGYITKAKVTGKADPDEASDVIDLIAPRLAVEFDDLQVGADLRWPREERWRALFRARNGWANQLR